MTEFKNIYDKEFFIIDSDNLDLQETKLYGYMISSDSNTVIQETVEDSSKLSPDGSYIFVCKEKDSLVIHQDFNGSYGLYLYQDDNYFCISNSFLKIVDYLKHKINLTMNWDVAKSYLSSTLCTISYKQTLINEINLILRNRKVLIDVKSKKIFLNKVYYNENSISLDSEEAFNILDNWFDKWINIFRNLKLKTDNLSIDLSGGIDSRLTFALMLSSKIDLNRINIRSLNDEVHTHPEDFKIASTIADYYNFNLNNKEFLTDNPQYFKEFSTILNLSFYTKLGFHNQLFFKKFRRLNPFYRITGAGGESLRNHFGPTRKSLIIRAEAISNEVVDSTNKIIEKNIEEYIKEYDISEEDYEFINYNETRRNNHFGRGAVESYLSNTIYLTPLIDSNLCKLKTTSKECDDDNLLVILIFIRYCPELLDFEFEGNKKFNQETIEYAKRLNNKYPFKARQLDLVSEKKYNLDKKYNNSNSENKPLCSSKYIKEYLKNIYLSDSYNCKVNMYFSPVTYARIAEHVTNAKFAQLQYVFPILSIIKAIDDVNLSNHIFDDKKLYWLEKYDKIPKHSMINNFKRDLYLSKYITGRLDIVNNGENSSIEIVECKDSNAVIRSPTWLNKKNRSGYVIQSEKTSLDIVFKTINEGKLQLFIRSIDFKDDNGVRIPIYIDFTKFTLNEKNIIRKNKVVWHNEPYVYEKMVKDNEIFKAHLEWQPLNSKSKLKKKNTPKLENKKEIPSETNKDVKENAGLVKRFKKRLIG